MLLVIHNLPSNTRYSDLKTLIKDKCGLTEMIVDNLEAEGNSKRVTVGLADAGDAAILMKSLNGLYVCNQQLYVEDVRQRKKNEQPFRPEPIPKPYEQERYNQVRPPPFEKQYYEQTDVQFQSQSPMTMERSEGPPAPNFGVPFYMSAQNQNVGNDLQYMVQYPKIQGPVGNEPYERRNMGFDKQYGGQKRNQPTSTDRGSHRERSPKRSSRWSEPDSSRSEGRRGLDRPAQRDDRHDADRSYKDKSYRDSYQSRSSQDYRSKTQSNNDRFEKPFNRSELNWERPDRSKFREQNEPRRFSENRNTNAQGSQYNQEREPQRIRENKNSHSSGYNYESRQSDVPKKRPYESPDKNKFTPPSKKFGGSQQRNSMNQQGASGSAFSKNYQNKKNSYPTKFQPRAPMQVSRPQIQSKFQQKPKVQKKPYIQKQANTKPTGEMLARHEAWRVQSASVIATRISEYMGNTRNKKNPILAALKSCVRARIDVIVGDDMSFTLKDMISKYNEKFQDDEAFYKMVCEKAAKGEVNEFGSKKKELEAKTIQKLNDIKPKTQFIGKPPALATDYAEALPKYPAGDKKVLSQLKQAQKDEVLKECLYIMDAEHEKALKEELDKFDELIKQQYENPEDETEKSICKFMDDTFVPDLRKILTLHVRKRILDVRTNLCVRVICRLKGLKKDLLHAFLKDYGVLSLKASERNRNVMIAICDTYENYDALCKQGSTEIDDQKISFKPLHITGPPMKGQLKKQLNIVANINKTEKSDGNKNIALPKENESGNNNEKIKSEDQNTEINENKTNFEDQENSANENREFEISPLDKSEDVIVIEEDLNKSNDVIIIDEDINKVTNEASKTDVDSKVETGDNQGSPTDKELVTVESDKVTIPDDTEIMERDLPELIDNDEIADDDLEDF